MFLALVLSDHICLLYTPSTFMTSESVTLRKSLSPDICRVCSIALQARETNTTCLSLVGMPGRGVFRHGREGPFSHRVIDRFATEHPRRMLLVNPLEEESADNCCDL